MIERTSFVDARIIPNTKHLFSSFHDNIAESITLFSGFQEDRSKDLTMISKNAREMNSRIAKEAFVIIVVCRGRGRKRSAPQILKGGIEMHASKKCRADSLLASRTANRKANRTHNGTDYKKSDVVHRSRG